MRRLREQPEVNAGSMADIAFLLIIFFIITATIKSDEAIRRKLPPMPDEEQLLEPEKRLPRNLFIVLINANNDLLVEGERLDISQLTLKAKEFIKNPTNSEELADKKEVDIPLLGKTQVSKGIISVQNDNSTTYKTYIAVQNELARAFNELRNELAMEKFGRNFGALNKEKATAIKKAIPQTISEAEPKDIKAN